MMHSIRRRFQEKPDEGFTLVELLVTIGLFAVLTTVVLSVVLNSATTLGTLRQSTDLNEESRLLLNRMSRELREANSVLAVENPDGASCHVPPAVCSTVSIHFQVDFDGDGVFESLEGEEPKYVWESSLKRVSLVTSTGACVSPGCPVVAANVEKFLVTYTSQRFECDRNLDGVVNWIEIDDRLAGDTCPDALGNDNDALDAELPSINSVTIDLTVLKGARRQDYRTQLDLRNRPQ